MRILSYVFTLIISYFDLRPGDVTEICEEFLTAQETDCKVCTNWYLRDSTCAKIATVRLGQEGRLSDGQTSFSYTFDNA